MLSQEMPKELAVIRPFLLSGAESSETCSHSNKSFKNHRLQPLFCCVHTGRGPQSHLLTSVLHSFSFQKPSNLGSWWIRKKEYFFKALMVQNPICSFQKVLSTDSVCCALGRGRRLRCAGVRPERRTKARAAETQCGEATQTQGPLGCGPLVSTARRVPQDTDAPAV